MWVYSASSCEEIVSFPILRAWIRTWRYRDSRAATPSESRSPSVNRSRGTAWTAVSSVIALRGGSSWSWPDSIEPGAEPAGVQVKLGDDLALDLNHRDPLEVPGQKPVVILDVDLPEPERRQLVAQAEDRAPCLVTQMAL